MKILFFIDTFSAGGKERRLMELMKGLKGEPGIEFSLVIMDDKIQYKEVYDLGIDIHHVIRKTKKDLSVFRKFYTICKTYKPDIVHSWDSMSAVYLVPILKILGIKFVNGMVTDAPEMTGIRNSAWLRARLTFPFSSVVIGNSLAGLKAYNAPVGKSICIRNGFNFKRTGTLKTNEQVRQEIGLQTKYTVGMVASYSRYKDYETYYKAAQLLLAKRRDITFLAIGTDTDTLHSKSMVTEMDQENFRFLGKRSDVESLINSMDLCVLATFTEGISNAILEYMALGKPVVATSGGGTNELIEDQVTGLLVEAKDPVALAEKMELLLEDDALRMSMGVAGKRRIHEYFTIERMVNEFVYHYKNIAKASVEHNPLPATNTGK